MITQTDPRHNIIPPHSSYWIPRLTTVVAGDDSAVAGAALSLPYIAGQIRQSRKWARAAVEYRDMVATLGKSHPKCKAYKTSRFGGVVVGGYIPVGWRRADHFPRAHSSLVQGDLDTLDSDALHEVRLFPATALAYASPSGAVKALLRVHPTPRTFAQHAAAWEAANRALCHHLGVPFSAADKTVTAANGLAFLNHDPTAYADMDAEPVLWTSRRPPARPPPARQPPAGTPCWPRQLWPPFQTQIAIGTPGCASSCPPSRPASAKSLPWRGALSRPKTGPTSR